MQGEPHFFFSVDHFLSDSFHYNKKNLYVGSFNFAFTIHMGSNCYITGVRDLEVALFKANSTWINGISRKNLIK